MADWISVREMERRRGVAHGAVRQAVMSGRIPESAVRRAPNGNIVAIEYEAATVAWEANTDADQALRTLATSGVTSAWPSPARQVPEVQTSAPRDHYAEEALRFHPALEIGFVSLPGLLAQAGLAEEEIDRIIEGCLAAMRRELVARAEPARLIARELASLLGMLTDERKRPGTWTE